MPRYNCEGGFETCLKILYEEEEEVQHAENMFYKDSESFNTTFVRRCPQHLSLSYPQVCLTFYNGCVLRNVHRSTVDCAYATTTTATAFSTAATGTTTATRLLYC